jgi:arylformamidase
VFIHGGAWLGGSAEQVAYPAEMFVRAGGHYVVPDFTQVKDVGGDLEAMATQVRRAIAWIYKNAASFDGDAERIYIGGHSSGGHLCGVALITDWEKDFAAPSTIVKGGLLISGLYEMAPVRLSFRGTYVNFTDAMADAMSAQRHIDKLNTRIIVAYGNLETPEFQRQSRDFAAAVKAAGKPIELIEGLNYTHSAIGESLGNPYGLCGRAALTMMKLG